MPDSSAPGTVLGPQHDNLRVDLADESDSWARLGAHCDSALARGPRDGGTR